MVQNDGRREVVNDPLAVTGREVLPDRSLALTGVRAPNNGGPSGTSAGREVAGALGAIQGAFQDYISSKKDEWITEGKVAYMSGTTEADLIKNGNRFTHQGYLQLKTRDDVNKWYMEEAAGIDGGANRADPAAYQHHLQQRREEFLNGIADPYAKKVAVAAFEQFSPQLAQSQFAKNNDFERNQRINAFGQAANSTAATSPTRSKVDPNGPLKLSDTPVLPVMQMSAHDREVGIRTMIGEAANQGAEGMAAVAHVIRNRVVDSRWPDSVAGVSLQKQQFSTWNSGAGGNTLATQYNPGNPIFDRAAKVFDAVMSGRHVDSTHGATHYYSPSGMTALVAGGSQGNTVPKWLSAEAKRSGGSIRIGGHIFVGKTSGATEQRAQVPEIAARVAANPESQLPTDPQSSLNAAPTNLEGVPDTTTGIAAVGAHNEAQDLIRNFNGLNATDKATAVAANMAAGLENGDDTFFRDGGGIGMLVELGATPAQIAAVNAANQKFKNKELDKFDASREAWGNDILTRAASGKTPLPDLLAEIDQKTKEHSISDGYAQSLARNAAASIRNDTNKVNPLDTNLEYRGAVGSLFQQINTGGLDFQAAGEQAKKIAKEYGAKPDDVAHLLDQVFALDQQHQNAIRTATISASKKAATNEATKTDVNAAISRGAGLNLVTGTVTVGDHKMSAKQFGIDAIKDKHLQAAHEKVAAEKLTKAEGIAEATSNTMLELQKQGVVDPKTTAELNASLHGNIMQKDGSLTNAAQQAYAMYGIMRHTPNLTDEYIAKTIPDNYTRGLLETAFSLDDGGGAEAHSTALRKAYDIMSDPNRDPNDKIAKDVVWRSKRDKGITDIISGKVNPGIIDRILGAEKATPGEQKRADSGREMAAAFIDRRADKIHLAHPELDGEVALKMATDDFKNSSTVIAGNLIISPDKNLSEEMNISSYGTDAPNEAVRSYIEKYGDAIWGAEYTSREQNKTESAVMGVAVAGAGAGFVSGGPNEIGFVKHPPMKITYNPNNNMMTVDLYKDEAKGITLGMPRSFNVHSIGQEYNDKQTAKTTWSDTWNSIFSKIGDTKKEIGQRRNGADAGAAIGSAFNPQ